MKIRKGKRNGFVLVIVIVTIALIGAEMFVLTGGSNTILFQANTAYLQACERNLTASGLAWAQKNIKAGNKESFDPVRNSKTLNNITTEVEISNGVDKSVNLDITYTSVSRSALSVTINTQGNGETDVQISSTVSRGRQTLSHNKKYQIGL